MKQKLINALKRCGFIEGKTLFLQGTMSAEESYPDEFVTFWVSTSENNAHFDNDVHSVDWDFSVIYYSNNPTLVNTKPNEIRTVLKSEGFIPQGKGNDILSDESTHTGWAMDFTYTENENF
jgi:hypothetical protein